VRLGQYEDSLAFHGDNVDVASMQVLDESITRLESHLSREKYNWRGSQGLGRAYTLRADQRFGTFRYADLDRSAAAYESIWQYHPEKRSQIACALQDVYEAMLAEPEWSRGMDQILKNAVVREKLARLQNSEFPNVDLVSVCEE
jgi:hypothetical protein